VIQIVPKIYIMEGLRTSNVYALVSPEGLTLVDSGMAGESRKIIDQLVQGDFALSDLRQIVLTHAHNDHAGSAFDIVQQSGARVLAHRDEVPYIEQTVIVPRSLLRRFLTRLGGFLFKQPACKVDVILADGDPVENSGGFLAVHTPGHTPGSLCLYHPERHILLCGDALFNRHPLTGKPGLQEPPAMVTQNTAQARESIRKLAKLEVEVLLCGHGKPILENAGQQIKNLVQALP